MQRPATTAPTDRAEAPIPTEAVSMNNGSNMKAEAPTPTETVSMSNDPTMKAEAPIPTETASMSNGSTMKAEAPIPTEIVSMSNEPRLIDDTVPLHRRAAKRTLPWDLAAEELDLVSQDEDNPARKKRRLEEPLPEHELEGSCCAGSRSKEYSVS